MILSRLVGNRQDAALFIIRVAVGLIFMAHGIHKLQTPLGVQTLSTGLDGMGFPMPLFWAWLVVVVEAIGGLFLVLGIFTRISALLIAIIMAVAIIKVKWVGFITLPGKGSGMDYPLSFLVSMLAVFFQGPGRYSIEGKFGKELS